MSLTHHLNLSMFLPKKLDFIINDDHGKFFKGDLISNEYRL